MTNTVRDKNGIPAIIAVDNTTGNSINLVAVNVGANNSLIVNDGVGGSDLGPSDSLRDENHETCLMAVSSVDGITPIVLYADSSGALLVQST